MKTTVKRVGDYWTWSVMAQADGNTKVRVDGADLTKTAAKERSREWVRLLEAQAKEWP